MAQWWTAANICNPQNRSCQFWVTGGNPENFLAIRRLCIVHKPLQATLSDADIHLACVQTWRIANAAGWAAKLELIDRGLMIKDSEWLPFTVDADGTIRIQSGRAGAVRTAIRNRVAAAVAAVEQVPGIPTVVVD